MKEGRQEGRIGQGRANEDGLTRAGCELFKDRGPEIMTEASKAIIESTIAAYADRRTLSALNC